MTEKMTEKNAKASKIKRAVSNGTSRNKLQQILFFLNHYEVKKLKKNGKAGNILDTIWNKLYNYPKLKKMLYNNHEVIHWINQEEEIEL